jgi:hypothetical protein
MSHASEFQLQSGPSNHTLALTGYVNLTNFAHLLVLRLLMTHSLRHSPHRKWDWYINKMLSRMSEDPTGMNWTQVFHTWETYLFVAEARVCAASDLDFKNTYIKQLCDNLETRKGTFRQHAISALGPANYEVTWTGIKVRARRKFRRGEQEHSNAYRTRLEKLNNELPTYVSCEMRSNF